MKMVARPHGPFSDPPILNKHVCALGFGQRRTTPITKSIAGTIFAYTIRCSRLYIHEACCELHFVMVVTWVILPICLLVASTDYCTVATQCHDCGYNNFPHCLDWQSNTFSHGDKIVIGIVSQPSVRTTKTTPLFCRRGTRFFSFSPHASHFVMYSFLFHVEM